MMKFVASLCPDLISELEKEMDKQAAKKNVHLRYLWTEKQSAPQQK